MGQCIDCPRIADHTCGPSKCCMDEPSRSFVFDVAREREVMMSPRRMDDLELNLSRGERRHGNPGRWRKKRLFRP